VRRDAAPPRGKFWADAMNNHDIPTAQLVLTMLLFLAIGGPIVLYDWLTLDQILTGVFYPMQIIVASALACVFLIGAALLGRYIRRLVPRSG
jgi:hypothetical protein